MNRMGSKGDQEALLLPAALIVRDGCGERGVLIWQGWLEGGELWTRHFGSQKDV